MGIKEILSPIFLFSYWSHGIQHRQSDMSISGELLLVNINLPMEECSSQPWQNQKIHGYLLISLSLPPYTLRAHHQECIFHMRMRPQKGALAAAPFEHKPTDSQTHSPLPNCKETNCSGLCLGRHVARKQARGVEPHADKLQGDHATRNYCSSLPSVITPLVRPATPLKPECK